MSEARVHGIHAIARRLQAAPEDCEELVCIEPRNPRILQLIDRARAAGVRVRFESRDEITRLAQTDKHQGCLLIGRDSRPAADFENCLQSIGPETLLLVLDGVQDPHNLGACLRTADAAGVDAVIASKHGAAGLGPTVSKVAAGAAESLPFAAVTNMARTLGWLGDYGVNVVGTSDSAEHSLYDTDLRGPLALVMGREHSGLKANVAERCTRLVRLPMAGSVSSLNVSVATGICLYEALRQRRRAPEEAAQPAAATRTGKGGKSP